MSLYINSESFYIDLFHRWIIFYTILKIRLKGTVPE